MEYKNVNTSASNEQLSLPRTWTFKESYDQLGQHNFIWGRVMILCRSSRQLTRSINTCQYTFCLAVSQNEALPCNLCPCINTSYCYHLCKCRANYRHDMPNSLMKIQLPSSLHLIIFFAFGINQDHILMILLIAKQRSDTNIQMWHLFWHSSLTYFKYISSTWTRSETLMVILFFPPLLTVLTVSSVWLWSCWVFFLSCLLSVFLSHFPSHIHTYTRTQTHTLPVIDVHDNVTTNMSCFPA